MNLSKFACVALLLSVAGSQVLIAMAPAAAPAPAAAVPAPADAAAPAPAPVDTTSKSLPAMQKSMFLLLLAVQ